MAELSPMMKQYKAIKEQHKDHILFYRLGDFYEMFFDDAVLVSKELEIALTGRDCGLPERAPMCGVPFHSCEGYIARLVKKGYKVAICEQTQNPAEAKGIVKREVIRVITPGTVIENSMLDEGKNNYIATVVLNGNEAGLCFCDISTGELFATELCDKDITLKILNELGRYSPTEVLVNENCRKNKSVLDFCANKLMALVGECDVLPQQVTEGQITKHFNKSLSELDLSNKPNTTTSLGILLTYLYQTQRLGLERISLINFYNETQFMNLGLDARRNLELTETMRAKERKGSLLWVLDKTKTAMGKRLIKNYIEQPLLNPAIISKRLNAVDELLNANIMRAEIIDTLSNIYDLERLMSRIVYGSTTPHELKSLEYTAGNLPQLKKLLCDVKSNMLCEIYSGIDTLDDVKQLISSAIEDDLPTNTKDGGFIRTGFNADVDEYRLILENSKQFLRDIELAEKEKTGIKNMKIGYNRVFGYYIEVSKGNIDQVPKTYIRKQTLANCERYITQELKDLETKILTAGDKLKALELALFDDIRKKVAGELHRIQKTAQMIASLDVFCSFAQTAVQNNYTRPDITIDGEIIIKDGRHPVVEVISDMPFVANDATFDSDDNRVAIITGPNMAGKSTYMRQTALIVLMAQIGSFVPASYAKIGIVDSIFTRVGAADDLASGQSTFMVEMSEVAYILKNATKKSLLILDEIGRGTSTFDGMSIARAILEYIADKRKLGAKTLFATHYHELTELENQTDGIKNYNIVVKKHGDDITFLRKIVRGAADDSYGIEVSKLAGISDSIITRAKEILRQIEDGQAVSAPKNAKKKEQSFFDNQIYIENPEQTMICNKLRSIDANVLTPIEAMNLLFELKSMMK